MSEYQWVEFRAVDAPLDDSAHAFMRKQSTRAEIDRWRFTNEYRHVAFNYDDEALEPPVPAGLGDGHHALDRLCEFYEIHPDLVSLAAEESSELKPANSDEVIIESWLKRQSKADLISNLERCLRDPNRHPSQLLRTIRSESADPVVAQSGTRTIQELRRRVEEIDAERERQRKAAAAKEADRRKAEAERALQRTLAKIADNPEKSFARIDAAINERNRPAYQRVAEELSLLAKACGKSMAIAKAESIRSKYPTRSALSSELKKAGF